MKADWLIRGLAVCSAIVLIEGGTPAASIGSPTPSQTRSTIVKRNWGVVFARPRAYRVAKNTATEVVLEGEETIRIDYRTGVARFTDDDAKFGPITFYWSDRKGKWLADYYSEALGKPVVGADARVVRYLFPGVPVFLGHGRWLTYVAAFTHRSFLRFNITGSGNTKPLDDLMRTVRRISSAVSAGLDCTTAKVLSRLRAKPVWFPFPQPTGSVFQANADALPGFAEGLKWSAGANYFFLGRVPEGANLGDPRAKVVAALDVPALGGRTEVTRLSSDARLFAVWPTSGRYLPGRRLPADITYAVAKGQTPARFMTFLRSLRPIAWPACPTSNPSDIPLQGNFAV